MENSNDHFNHPSKKAFSFRSAIFFGSLISGLFRSKAIQQQILLLFIFCGALTSSFAATITVTNGNDSGTGSLRTAINASASGDIIVFSGVTTVTLTSAELLIDNNLTINGGSGVTITRSGSTLFRIFRITVGTVTLNNLTISNGNANGDAGGGIYSVLGTTVTLNTCVITGNQSGQGGGIQVDGTMSLTNCRINNNTSVGGEGGGVAAFGSSITFTGCTINNNNAPFYDGLFISASGIAFSMTNCTISGNAGDGILYSNGSGSPTATLTNCTITDNTWGLAMVSGTVLLKNTIIADNFSQDIFSGTGFNGTISSSSSHNLIGNGGSGGLTNGVNNNLVGVVDPGLIALASNGGATQTHALSGCSPALNAGTSSGAPTTDQRGSSRVGAVDIGSFEYQSAPSSISITSSVTNACNGNNGSINLTVSGGSSPYTYTWSGSGSGTDPRTNLAAGTYNVTVTGGGCTGTHSAMVTNLTPTTANAGPDQTGSATCGLTQVTLAANTPTTGTGAWSVFSGSGGSFGNASSPTSTFSGTAGSTYTLRWTISNGTCTSTNDVVITFNANPVVTCPLNMSAQDADPAFALSGASPTGGTYSGPGVSGGMFNPSVAGLGMHTIQYNYTSPAGCAGSCAFTITVTPSCTVYTWYLDADNDNYYTGSGITQCTSPGAGYRNTGLTGGGDCNDNNAAIKPGATEVCDGIDNDCDGSIDEGALTTYYRDMDGDGFGNLAVTQQACSVPTGYVTNNTDCNDNPAADGALEFPGQVWYDDTDGDGFGQTGAASITQCLRPAGYKAASELTATTGDCNDAVAAINPNANEVCDGIDNDCDGSTDEGGLTTYYQDLDGDGFGNAAMNQQACSQPVGYVANNTDCDDNDALEKPGQVWYKDVDGDDYSDGSSLTQCLRPANHYAASELIATTGDCNDNNAAIKPGATEVCDGIDNDCDGSTDEGGLTTYYQDLDGDGFGNAAMNQQACSQPVGYVTNNTDCDDNDALEKPGQVWYKDVDGDDYSDGSSLTQCLRPANYYAASELIATTGDCNDNNAAIKPGATEICDGIDNDCDGSIDEGILTTYYRDMDGDGFGNLAVTQQACSLPTGYVTNNTDCNDNPAAGGALEFPGQVWYDDTDGDGFGQTGAASITQCLRPAGYKAASELTATTGDCNDAVAAINPNANEICDGIDNNCDGNIDEGTLTTYYRDMDGDGFGNLAVTQQACSLPTGYVTNSTDCNDNPATGGALEFPGQVWYDDTDGDGFGQTGAASITQCLRPAGYKAASELTSTTGDCNDAVAAINPNANEICDGIDNDCDGSIDEGALTTYYQDLDGDGFGNLAVTQQACSVPTGYVTNSTDCNDNPATGGALEFPGQVWYDDTDNDGFGQTGAAPITQCLRPAGYKAASELTATTGDCNDAVAAINPNANEICDGIDNDCDGSIDEGVLTTYYRDMDGDGFGDAANTSLACSLPSGYVTNNTDCNDNSAIEFPGQVWYKDADGDGYSDGTTITQCLRPAKHYLVSELEVVGGDCNDNDNQINPAATEVCDDIDNDCNGLVDDLSGGTVGNWQQENVGSAGDLEANFPACLAEPSDLFTVSSTNVSTPTSDNLSFVFQSLCGNSSITARVLTVNGSGWAGVMMRESLAPGAKKVALKTQLSTLIRREIRSTNNGPTTNLQFVRPQHIWLRLVRSGSTLTGYTSLNGQAWSFAFTATISMEACIYLGVFSESTSGAATTTATFDQVSVTGGSAILPLQQAQTGFEEAAQSWDIDVYPNPSHGLVTLHLLQPSAQPLSVRVLNTLGEQLMYLPELPAEESLRSLDLSALPSGIYYLLLDTAGQAPLVKRVVITQE